ncbi:tRNA pseudouridine synthase [Epithele typhae]|uniref:tRNA pseudouridine synthase n=1 Tax=Epithele typhae TaxID=378194 RepID=UPI0020078D1D|nr:tRNA pseudouridine synthase [Epithele typhae]KAH9916248.1 tRNA pseudouridine synthase [Epithele typhae]
MIGSVSYRISRRYASLSFPRMDPYKHWTREELIARLQHLTANQPPEKPEKEAHRPNDGFNFDAYPRRKIALKVSYNGVHHGGFESQAYGSLPTVEGTLFDALVHARLIDPAKGLQGCGWEKCGRTDVGVSGAGQVVSFWIRSALGSKLVKGATSGDALHPPSEDASVIQDEDGPGLEGDFGDLGDLTDEAPSNSSLSATPASSALTDDDEIGYVPKLNSLLPPTIRVLSWAPVPDDFSARFHCKWRHYKYFFSPAGLDLPAMRDAAARLVGLHDFRNLCRIDPSKQQTVFLRRILAASIDPVDPADPRPDALLVFNLRGTAFLYNMVRHIMAVLFLVGARLERPSIVDALLNADPAAPRPASRPDEPAPPVVTGRPEYQIADPQPLVLWECGYDAADAPPWRAAPSDGDTPNVTLASVLAARDRAQVAAALADHFARALSVHMPLPVGAGGVPQVPLGGGASRRWTTYTPLLRRKRLRTPEEINERWRLTKGAKRAERKAAAAATTEVQDDGGE